MNISFKRIEISNFLSIGKAEITLDGRGFVRVIGKNLNPSDGALSNGSGKSSIFDAIVWALTGETVRGVTNGVSNIYGDDGAVVTLCFDCDGKSFEVTRTRGHSTLKNNLLIKVNGEDKSGKGLRDTEGLLADLLPELTSELIGSVIILGQGMPQRFTNNTPSGRKEVLEKLSKSDYMIEDLKERISSRKQELEREKTEQDNEILKLTTEIQMLENTIKSCEEERNGMASRETLVETEKEKDSQFVYNESMRVAYEKKVSELTNKVSDLRVQYSQLSLSCKEEKDKETETLNKEREELVNEDKSLCIELKGYHSELDRLSKITDICPTCGQKLIGITKPDTSEIEAKIKEKEARYEEVFEMIKAKDKAISEKTVDIDAKYDCLKQKVVDEGNLAKKELDENKRLFDSYSVSVGTSYRELCSIQSAIASYDEKVSGIANRISQAKSDIVDKEKRVEYIKSVRVDTDKALSFVSILWTEVTRGFRGYLLSNALSFIDSKAKEYSETIFGNSLISIALDGNSIAIKFGEKDYENLSGGERQKVDLIVQFAIRDMLCKFLNFDCNLLVVDEVFDNLDSIGCERVMSLISSLNNISSIFVITHHGDELLIPYDEELIVTKNEQGISEVSSR